MFETMSQPESFKAFLVRRARDRWKLSDSLFSDDQIFAQYRDTVFGHKMKSEWSLGQIGVTAQPKNRN